MSERKKVTIYGERLKQEAKKRGWKNKNMAEFLMYANEKTISNIYSGYTKLSDDRFKRLSKEWGLREDYLRCYDNFPTDEDVLKCARIIDSDAFTTSKAYLASLGITFEMIIETYRMPVTKLYDRWDEVKPYLSPSTITDLLNKYDFSLDSQQFHIKYFGEYHTVRWMKPFDDIDLQCFANAGKNEPIQPNSDVGHFESSFQDFFFNCSESKLGVSVEYSIGLEIYYNEEFKGKTDFYGLQSFMQKLDKFTLFFASDLLFKE